MEDAPHERWEPSEADDLVMRLAEQRLADLLTTSLAADQRAGVLAGLLAASCAAIFSAVPDAEPGARAALVLAGAFFLGGAFDAFEASRPRSFYLGGYEPRHLIGTRGDIASMRVQLIGAMQSAITYNKAVLERQAKLTKRAFRFAVAGVLVGVFTFSAIEFLGGRDRSSSQAHRGQSERMAAEKAAAGAEAEAAKTQAPAAQDSGGGSSSPELKPVKN